MAKAKTKMQSVSHCNINQHCYFENWLVYANLNRIIKDSKIKKFTLKT